MKKILIPICALTLIFMVAPMALAEPTSSQDGVTVTVGTLTYDASPNVFMSITSTATDYCIASANSVTDTDNGMEYTTLSSSTGYAQRTKTTDATEGPADCTDAETIASGTWTWMGGS